MSSTGAGKLYKRILMVFIAVPGVAIAVLLVITLTLLFSGKLHLGQVCPAHARAIGTALIAYATEFDDRFPPGDKWCDLLLENTDLAPETLKCPYDRVGPSSYALNVYALEHSDYLPANVVLGFESKPGWNQAGARELLSTDNHYGKGCTIIFGDGQSKWVKAEDLDKLRWKVGLGEN